MIRCSCPMLASSLLLMNIESNKRTPSNGRLLPDSGAANASWANGLTMPMMDPLQIKLTDAGRRIMLFPYFSEHVAKIKSLAGRLWLQQERHRPATR